MKTANLIISLDFELFWGLSGWNKNQLLAYKAHIEGAIDALTKIIEIFKKYEIKCTIGFVGGINSKSLDDFLEAAPSQHPTYKNELLSSYGLLLKLVRTGIIDNRLLFRPDIIKLLQENPLIELASHTFSHYYALEDGQNIEQFEADITTARKESMKANIELKTIIFPRNQISKPYQEICSKHGFTHIRGNEESLLYKSETTPSKYDYKRILRLLDCYINITGHHTYITPKAGTLIDVTASRFLRPYNKMLRFLEPLKIKRIKDDIKYAAKNGEIYHIWWHPHNFGVNTDKNIEQLELICKFYKEMQNKYGIESKFISEILPTHDKKNKKSSFLR
ncbi:polysaccharide deacetylase family protein [Phocaeicola barnesiae]|uniref:polysaccharide deacetylase family protein n=1 Tax=Phocaeicola barnesiae TaxID=376804 RepID=UPI0025A3695B|nr:polysaccharide deacetylase family protein [Phocaeicola barnesiae]MDM8255593.1 polysaccharide deacetylase family protein [Phocaeicola barnesiae]